MNDHTSAPRRRRTIPDPNPRRPRTPIELIDSIVDCDNRTSRTTRIIFAITNCVAIVVLTIAIAGLTHACQKPDVAQEHRWTTSPATPS